ncbi:MAG TPA: diguanylate cyclase, partial [Candidatus Acidoferrum sp.]|nr:diguanylate cyclase [Candidatus Acidoferrum sp.]
MGQEIQFGNIPVDDAGYLRSAAPQTDDLLLRVIDLAVEYYWEQDAGQRFTRFIPSGQGRSGLDAAQFLGRTFWELDDAATASLPLWQSYRASFAACEPITDCVVWRHDERRGSYYHSISGRPRFDADGVLLGYYGIVRDVTAEKANQDHADSLELAAIGVAHVGPAGRIIHANRKLCDMLGYGVEELRTLSVAQISHPEDTHLTDVARKELSAGRLDSFKCEKRYLRKNGSVIWAGLTIAVKWDAHGRELYHVSIVEDISARKEAEARVQYLATHDEMTGLPNRALFSQLLRHELEASRRYQRKFAVLFIDLDRFKQINDSLGHEAGDVLLKEMAVRFKACVRASDVVARLGGDEFVVLVPEVAGTRQVAKVARNLLAAALKPVEIMGHECRVTASIGISAYPANGEDEQTLLKHADIAMYAAKEEGKNNYQFYAPGASSPTIEKLAMESNLRQAVERGEMWLEYQAKVNITTGVIHGVEALLRWNNPTLGQVSPALFIPAAEEMGIIVHIGKWVIRQACEQIGRWDAEGLPPVCVAVNLSPRQFADTELLPWIRQVLRETGIVPGRLELEVTESMVMHNAERALQKL